jgi:hypothetical protein
VFRLDVMRKAVGFPCGAIVRQRKNGALSDEMRRGIILVQIGENGSESLA